MYEYQIKGFKKWEELSMFNKKFLKQYYIMLIPGFIWLALFSIIPMFGIVMAFQNFNPIDGILKSDFVGLENFKYMFRMSDTKQVFINTIVIAVGKLIGNLIIPLIFALLLNELCIKKLFRPIQTIVYLPYFLSWVILAKIILNIFGFTGPVNNLLQYFGVDSINFFGRADLFRPLVIGTDIWKGFGYNAVIYLAALLGIDPTLYEAAAVDGSGRFSRLLHITLPGIKTTIALLAILSLGNVLNAGFEQIFNLYNPLVYSTGDILDTWVYRAGLVDLQFSLATTVGLLKSVVSLILITVGYWLADKFAGYKIF
jgi:putative aldouronate transport system permease protein